VAVEKTGYTKAKENQNPRSHCFLDRKVLMKVVEVQVSFAFCLLAIAKGTLFDTPPPTTYLLDSLLLSPTPSDMTPFLWLSRGGREVT